MKKVLFGISMFVMFFFVISLSSCGEKACEHKEEIIAGKAATCTEAGLTDGKKCSVCQEILVAQEAIEANGHTEEEVEAKAATCTEAGIVAHTHCSVCEKNFDAEGNELSDVVIPASHDLTDVAEVPATCTEAGVVAHTHCTVCEKNFGAEGKELSDVVIPASHDLTDVAEVPATCTEAGVVAHTHCSVCEKNFDAEGKELSDVVIPAGHIDKNLDIECDREGCTSKVAPKGDSELSIYTANCLGSKVSTSNQYYVSGVVSRVDDAKSGIFFIKDETGEEFYIRLPKDANGTTHASWESKIVVGDVVKFYGKINKFSSSSLPNGYLPSMQSAVLVERTHNHEFSEATCTKVATCACGSINGTVLPHNDVNEDRICDDCNFDMDCTVVSISVKNTDTAVADNLKVNWGNSDFDVIIEKGTASQLYYNNPNYSTKDFTQLYGNSNLVISSKNGQKIKTITIVATSESEATKWVTLLTTAGYDSVADGVEVSFDIDLIDTFTITATGNIKLSAVKITYKNI